MFWSNRKRWPQVKPDEIRKRSKILVIDDSDFPYLALFEKDEYSVEQWRDVDNLEKLEAGYYDLILLDIQGVGKDLSAEQGLGVLKHIHSVNPAQIIVAFSNADWSLKYQDFFRMADATLAKSADYYEFKRTVDRLLMDRFTLDFYVTRLCGVLGDRFQDDQRLQKVAREAILCGSTAKLEQYLKKITEHSDAIGLALKIAKAAITLLTMLC